MNTIYGYSPDEYWENYFKSLVSKVFKILPLREENVSSLNQYIESLLRELIGNQELADAIKHNEHFLALCGTLQNLLKESDIKTYKTDVFKCINLVKKIQSSMKDGDES
jgi:hypothetical protein